MPTKTCPHCAEEIQDKAVICKHCKTDLRNPSTSSPQPTVPQNHPSSANDLLSLKSTLDAKQLLIFQTEFDKHKKSIGLAYFLLFLLGGLGGHAFYLDRRGSGVGYLLCTLFGFSFMTRPDPEMNTIGGFLLMLNGIRALYDVFTLTSQVRKKNEQIEKETLAKFFALQV